MTDLDKFLFQPKYFEDMIYTAKIVIDTNVLLAAYQYKNITFAELINTLESLNHKDRLVIPSHVITEFFKNRPDRIVKNIQTVQQIRDGLQKIKPITNIESKIPSMEFFDIRVSIQKIENELNENIKITNEKISEYQKKLNELISKLKTFFNNDIILEKYKSVFEKAYFKPDSLKSAEEITAEFKKREKINFPPGYKDGKKTENAEGDYLIWEHILQIHDDVIFVTADNKADWVYSDPNGNVISARRELVEEFYQASEGHSICIVHPSVFLKRYNPLVDTEIIQDLDKNLLEQIHDESLKPLGIKNDVYKDLLSSLIKNTRESERVRILSDIPTKRYIVGAHKHLDNLIRMLQENDQEDLLFEALRQADFIASTEDIDEEDRAKRYRKVAIWGINKLNDRLINE